MIAWAQKHAVTLAAGAAFGYWFFTGTDPIMLARGIVGNGRKLARHHLSDGRVVETLDELVATATQAAGRAVGRDAYQFASVSASEHAYASPKEKALIQRVMLNRVRIWGQGVEQAITGGKGMGKQSGGRPCSTVNGPWELDLVLAEQMLAGQIPDDSYGALFFVHKTGFRTVTDYRDVCARWYDANGIVPVDVGEVSSLRIFVDEELAKREGLHA
jgi:hypothetical protein